MEEHLIEISTGSPTPQGVQLLEVGVNFALFAPDIPQLSLALFEVGAEKPFETIPFDSNKNLTNGVWHILISGLSLPIEYAYQIEEKSILDPFARGISGDRALLRIDEPFDWEHISRPMLPMEKLIIYEMHVRGFTQDPSSQVQCPGTFRGVIEKIPYLKDLGVNAVELMPIFSFDVKKQENSHLSNYWGYDPEHFFAPMTHYSSSANAMDELREMVKSLHREGIEVILDVVYNHTSENCSLHILGKSDYYFLSEKGEYMNYSGCGNTLQANKTQGHLLILESLRYWVKEAQVDGFRFDLASCLTRAPEGLSTTLLEAIHRDPFLSKTKLIAEPWDPGGLYQVGQFPKWGRWSEWNGKYRDRVRCFIKGSECTKKEFALALTGSPDLYSSPLQSINFITAHDGFTLHDLVSYQEKRNEANGEEGRDGTPHNMSWNCGAEGQTDDIHILELRKRQMKNFLTALMVSLGVPMLLMGDEYGHTRHGNNNAWCQDNALNYFQWDQDGELREFLRSLITLRKSHPLFEKTSFYHEGEIQWHGIKRDQFSWDDDGRFLAYSLFGHDRHLYIAFNTYFEELHVELPLNQEMASFKILIDTSDLGKEILSDSLVMLPYSVLIAQKVDPQKA